MKFWHTNHRYDLIAGMVVCTGCGQPLPTPPERVHPDTPITNYPEQQ